LDLIPFIVANGREHFCFKDYLRNKKRKQRRGTENKFFRGGNKGVARWEGSGGFAD